MVDKQTIQYLCNRILQEFRPERIILFGSYANGNPAPDSDVDILVVLPFEGKILYKSHPGWAWPTTHRPEAYVTACATVRRRFFLVRLY